MAFTEYKVVLAGQTGFFCDLSFTISTTDSKSIIKRQQVTFCVGKLHFKISSYIKPPNTNENIKPETKCKIKSHLFSLAAVKEFKDK